MSWIARFRNSSFPMAALASLLVLLIAAVAIALLNERSLKLQTAGDAGAQADLLA